MMRDPVKVAVVQIEPVVFDRDATIEKMAGAVAEAAAAGAKLVVFPEAFIPVYPSSTWSRALAFWHSKPAKEMFARLARQAVEIPGPAHDRLASIARDNGVWLVTGATERDPAHPGTLYNSLLYYSPTGELANRHRKTVPTAHEKLIWGQGDASGIPAIDTEIGRIGGLICWENYMPLARFALYQSGVEIYIAASADEADTWQQSLGHFAREAGAYVLSPCHFQRRTSYPEDFELGPLPETYAPRAGSAIIAPDGSYLAGPLFGEEGILYAELDPQMILEVRQRHDAAGHSNRPDLFDFSLRETA